MKQWIAVFILLTVGMEMKAQKKWQFHSQNYVGLLEGEVGSAFQFHTINGIQRGTWFAGLGTGLDWYMHRSVPLFLSINKDWKPSNRTFYFSLDGGTNFAWSKNQDGGGWSDFISREFSPALFWGAGIGYKAGLRNKKDAVLINLGYSFKRLKEEQIKSTYCINPPCPNYSEYYDYKTNRVSLRFGWQF